jgi:gliding motility-associated transport system ATP-binding protein
MIEASGLSKFYGDFAAVRNVSFCVPQGQVAAFLGPNGAGKSTTLKILTGYLTPSEGVARIGGLDVLEHRIEAAGRIGYLPENGPLYPEMTPLELLHFFGEARGLAEARLKSRIDAVVTECNLQAVLEKSIHKLSKGYRQRVGMAQALLHEPDILIMDEPTSGLDPNQIHDVRLLIRRLGETKTILISTHILQEVSAVCDHVILINEGRVVFDGTPAEMAAGGSLEDAFHRLTQAIPAPQAAAPESSGVEPADLEPPPAARQQAPGAAGDDRMPSPDGRIASRSPDPAGQAAHAAPPDTSTGDEQHSESRTTGGAE